MTAPRDPERLIKAFLGEGEEQLHDQVYDAVRASIEHKRQRVVIGPRSTPTMNRFLTFGLAAAAVVVALLIGAQLLTSAGGGIGNAPSPSPESTATAEPSGAQGLPVGSSWDLLPEGDPHVNVTIPASGWSGDGGILTKGDHATFAGMITFASPLYVYGDPCHWESTTPGNPSTTVDELVTALSAQASRDASDPVDVTLGGYAGKSMTLHVPEDIAYADSSFTDCDQGYFGSWGAEGDATPARYQQGPGQIDELWILDVDGDLVVIDATHFPGTPADVVDEKRAIVESATFE